MNRIEGGGDSRAAHAPPAGEVTTMAKATTELAQRRPPPPYTHWDQRGKPVLLSDVELIEGKAKRTKRLSLKTEDPDIAKRHMEVLVGMWLRQGRLSPDSGAAREYGLKRTRRRRFDALETEVRRLKALFEAEYGSEALATAERWGLPVGFIHDFVGRKPEVSAGTYRTRRMRARQRGEQTAMGTSWHHRPQGEKYFFRNGRVMNGRLHLGGRVHQWSLKTRDPEVAAAIMTPVRLARERVREAAAEVLGSATEAAAITRNEACRRLAEAIIGAGGPMEAAKFVVKASPDAESLQPDRPPLEDAELEAEIRRRRAGRKAMRAASLKKCEERYFELIQAQPGWAPKARADIEKDMMDKFKVTRDETRECRAKAISRYNSVSGNWCNWGEAGDRAPNRADRADRAK
jgi:hypothetical protein